MKCKYCSGNCVKKGFQSTKQRYQCKKCNKYQLELYTLNRYGESLDATIIKFWCNGVGVRSSARILEVSASFVLSRIAKIILPKQTKTFEQGDIYEIDEMCTYVGNKKNQYFVIYAISRTTPPHPQAFSLWFS